MSTADVIDAAERALAAPPGIVGEALSAGGAVVTPALLEAAMSQFKALKHAFVDQRTQLLLASSISSAADPFAALAGGAKEAQDAAVSQRKEAVCAAKRELEAARDEIGALCERIAGEYAGLQLGRHALASELELLKQAYASALASGGSTSDDAPTVLRVELTGRGTDGVEAGSGPRLVELGSEAAARSFMAEQTLAASSAMAATLALHGKRHALEAEAAAIAEQAAEAEEALERVRAERGALARQRATEAQRAHEAARFYNAMSDVLAAALVTA